MIRSNNNKAILLVISFLILCSFANEAQAGRKVSLEEMKLEISKISHDNLGIIIWDQRPQVIDKSQSESFIGYIYSLAGIAWPYFIKGDLNFSAIMLKKVQLAYSDIGVKVNSIESSPFDKEDKISEKVQSYDHDKVLLLRLNHLRFDGFARIEYVVDIDVQLFNSSGEVLFETKIIDEIKMGGAGRYKRTAPETLKSIFENALNNTDLIEAISGQSKKESIKQPTNMYDLLVKKNGEELEAKILEIDKNVIKYKLANHLEGPTRVVEITEVFMIKYENGTKELFN